MPYTHACALYRTHAPALCTTTHLLALVLLAVLLCPHAECGGEVRLRAVGGGSGGGGGGGGSGGGGEAQWGGAPPSLRGSARPVMTGQVCVWCAGWEHTPTASCMHPHARTHIRTHACVQPERACAREHACATRRTLRHECPTRQPRTLARLSSWGEFSSGGVCLAAAAWAGAVAARAPTAASASRNAASSADRPILLLREGCGGGPVLLMEGCEARVFVTSFASPSRCSKPCRARRGPHSHPSAGQSTFCQPFTPCTYAALPLPRNTLLQPLHPRTRAAQATR